MNIDFLGNSCSEASVLVLKIDVKIVQFKILEFSKIIPKYTNDDARNGIKFAKFSKLGNCPIVVVYLTTGIIHLVRVKHFPKN